MANFRLILVGSLLGAQPTRTLLLPPLTGSLQIGRRRGKQECPNSVSSPGIALMARNLSEAEKSTLRRWGWLWLRLNFSQQDHWTIPFILADWRKQRSIIYSSAELIPHRLMGFELAKN